MNNIIKINAALSGKGEKGEKEGENRGIIGG